MGLRIAEANIHAGPQLASFDVGQTKIFVRLFPIGSGLTFLERPVEPPLPTPSQSSISTN